jgi:(R)-2-hydroxyacyl-CoA dehydratese activating ATPase
VSGAAAIGIDAGSTTCKLVAIDAEGRVLGRRLEPASPRIDQQAATLFEALRAEVGGAALVGATGYGRKRVAAGLQLTEITCHARGAFAQTRRSGLLVDMGGQDTKAIRVGANGEVLDFAMNDKCAAGTGRFLEIILQRLGLSYSRAAEYASRATRGISISSTCTVFAESEVISLIAAGEPLEAIVKGIHVALAARVAALARTRVADEIWMSGGVALNPAMVATLAAALGRPVRVLEEPQFVGALGAALAVLRA